MKMIKSGWNKRRNASNNFCEAIMNGEITSSMLAKMIMGVKNSTVEKLIPGAYHHIKKGKKIIKTKTFKKENITTNLICNVILKEDQECYAREKNLDQRSNEVLRYKKQRRSEIKLSMIINIYKKIINNWDKMSQKLKKKYCPST